MAKPFDDMQRINQTGVDAAMKLMGEWGKSWQAIAAEMADYSKRTLEDGTQTLGRLMSAKSIEQAIEIQSSYAKRACDDYLHQLTKLGGMYSELAKDAYRPVEKTVQGGR